MLAGLGSSPRSRNRIMSRRTLGLASLAQDPGPPGYSMPAIGRSLANPADAEPPLAQAQSFRISHNQS